MVLLAPGQMLDGRGTPDDVDVGVDVDVDAEDSGADDVCAVDDGDEIADAGLVGVVGAAKSSVLASQLEARLSRRH